MRILAIIMAVIVYNTQQGTFLCLTRLRTVIEKKLEASIVYAANSLSLAKAKEPRTYIV